MIKIEIKDTIQYFNDEHEFGKWLIENNYVLDLRSFIIDEYTALEVLEQGYTMEDVKVRWWDVEIKGAIHEWFNIGLAEEV